MQKAARTVFLTAIATAFAAASTTAEPITLQYVVNVTERAKVVAFGTTPVDQRVGLSLGPSEGFAATFNLMMTFDVLLGHSTGSGFGADQALFTFYGRPTFSLTPLPKAAALVSPIDPGTETNLFGQTFEQQGLQHLSGSSYTNWGAYLIDTVQLPRVAESGSTTLPTHIMPATLSGPDDFHLVPLATYLEDMRSDLDFDFVTWSIFNLSSSGEEFSGDSYNYRGTADFVALQPVPEPATLTLIGVGLAALTAARRPRRKSRS